MQLPLNNEATRQSVREVAKAPSGWVIPRGGAMNSMSNSSPEFIGRLISTVQSDNETGVM
jgi:hypothetical protein